MADVVIHYSPGNTRATRVVHGGPVVGEYTSNMRFVTCKICEHAVWPEEVGH